MNLLKPVYELLMKELENQKLWKEIYRDFGPDELLPNIVLFTNLKMKIYL